MSLVETSTDPVKPHLMDGEEPLSVCTGGEWEWVCTTDRLLRFTVENSNGSKRVERLHDLSFSEISSIEIENTGPNDQHWSSAKGCFIFGLILLLVWWLFVDVIDISAFMPSTLAFVLTVVVGALSLFWFYLSCREYVKWVNDDGRRYFRFLGPDLLQEKEWRLYVTDANDPDDVREFVKVVRGQM